MTISMSHSLLHTWNYGLENDYIILNDAKWYAPALGQAKTKQKYTDAHLVVVLQKGVRRPRDNFFHITCGLWHLLFV